MAGLSLDQNHMSWLDDYIRQQSAPPSELSVLQALIDPQKPTQQPRQTILQQLSQTWPARMAQSAVSAASLPGDVYSGRIDPMSQEAINRANDLAGLGITSTIGAPAVVIGAGITRPIRAFHGSPHAFDRFDITKMGAGEGAQTFGRGLYFAENPKIAQYYADTLKQGNLPTYMYEVDIKARPNQFLPWDESVSGDMLSQVRNIVPANKRSQFEHLARVRGSGADLYKDILEADIRWKSPQITQQLNDVGIPGIRYSDQGSRTFISPNQTSNYVLFDDKLVDILRRY